MKIETDLMLPLIKLTNLNIKSIARLCGSPTTGTKSVLIDSLKFVTSSRTLSINENIRVISIDLGIKNIGISQILVPPWQSTVKPKVEKWMRGCLKDSSHKFPQFADHAMDFVERLTEGAQIDYFILEKQRSRTAGSSNIPTDVLKVNVMEGMMFTALRQMHKNSILESISPRSIVDFWNVYSAASTKKNLTVGQAYRLAKQTRRRLVDGWLANSIESPLEFSTQLPDGNSKRDDMNDALVQAYTWIKWRFNCAQLLANCHKHTADLSTGLFIPVIKTC